ncbi:CNNM domain-containing protein [Candidatus Erwinia dacicola]
MTLNRYKLCHLAKNGNRAARQVEKLLRCPDRLIRLMLIGNNLVNMWLDPATDSLQLRVD